MKLQLFIKPCCLSAVGHLQMAKWLTMNTAIPQPCCFHYSIMWQQHISCKFLILFKTNYNDDKFLEGSYQKYSVSADKLSPWQTSWLYMSVENVIFTNIILTTDGSIGCAICDAWSQIVGHLIAGAGPHTYSALWDVDTSCMPLHTRWGVGQVQWATEVVEGFLRWSPGILNRTSSSMCDNWNLPTFLLRDDHRRSILRFLGVGIIAVSVKPKNTIRTYRSLDASKVPSN